VVVDGVGEGGGREYFWRVREKVKDIDHGVRKSNETVMD
jgi:hypothetical protein